MKITVTLTTTTKRAPLIGPTLDSLLNCPHITNVAVVTSPATILPRKHAKLWEITREIPEVPARRYLTPCRGETMVTADDDMLYNDAVVRVLASRVATNPHQVYQAGGYCFRVAPDRSGFRYHYSRAETTTDLIQPGAMVAFAPEVYRDLQSRLTSHPEYWEGDTDLSLSDDYAASRELSLMGIPRIIIPALGQWTLTPLDSLPDQLHNRGDGNMRKLARLLSSDPTPWNSPNADTI